MGYILGEPTVQQYFDANGDPLENGTIEFYVWNTSTPTAIYSDSTGTSAGTSVTLNSIGAPSNGGTSIALFFDTSVIYKIIRKDSFGTAISPTIGPYLSIDSNAQFDFTAKELLLPEIVSTSGSLVDIDFDLSTLESTYDRFIIEGYAISDYTVARTDVGYIYFNEDLTDANYFSQALYAQTTTVTASSAANPSIVTLASSWASALSDSYTVFTIVIESPMVSSYTKGAINTGSYSRESATLTTLGMYGVSSSITDAITRIRIRTDDYATDKIVGNFRIYGEREVSIVAAELGV